MSFGPAHLSDLLEEVVGARIRFVLVGGLAVGAWGHVRSTKDLDVVPDPDRGNIDRLIALLEDLDGRVIVDGEPLGQSAIGTFLRAGDKTLVRTRLGDIDVLQNLPQVPRYEELAERAERAELFGTEVRVCSLEDLRKMKRAADRALDRADLEALEIAHSAPSPEERD